MYGWEPTFESLGKPIPKQVLGVAFKTDRGMVTAIFHVCSGLLILHVSSTPAIWVYQRDSKRFPIKMYGWEPTFESLGKPIPKQVSSGWHLKQIEEWLLLSSMCAVVCSYCMSHQHLDAKIVNISHRDVWVVSHRNVPRWEPTFESLG